MAFSRKCIDHNCFQNVAASRSLAKQSPVRRTKLTLRRLLQRHKPPLRNDMALLSSILEKTMGAESKVPQFSVKIWRFCTSLEKGRFAKQTRSASSRLS